MLGVCRHADSCADTFLHCLLPALKRACRRHGIARWPRRPAQRPLKHMSSPTAGDIGTATDTTVRGGLPLTSSASAHFDLGTSLCCGIADTWITQFCAVVLKLVCHRLLQQL
jgi:hypothetical protein